MISIRIGGAIVVGLVAIVSTACGEMPAGGDRLSVAQYLELVDQARARMNAQQWREAADLWAKAVEQNPVNVSLWGPLATARYNARDFAGAIAAYEKVRELGAGPPSLPAYSIARCHAQLENKEAALEWLERSFREGFRFLNRPQTDPDLASVRDDPRFATLVGRPGPGKPTRDEGWRQDLALLVREVRRKGYDPFRQTTPDEFDAAVRHLDESVPGLSDLQIIIEMKKLLRKVGDGHTAILAAPLHQGFFRALPLQFYFFAEGLFVVAADPKYRELLGAQILRFDDRTVEEVSRTLDPLISRDNDVWLLETIPHQMRYPAFLKELGQIGDAKQVTFTIRDFSGSERTVQVSAQAGASDIWNVRPHPQGWIGLSETLPEPAPLYLKNRGADYWFEQLPESRVVYCQYNRIVDAADESLAAFAQRLFRFIDEQDVDKLVIDLRWNNGGNTFLHEPFFRELMRSTKVNQRGKLFVIIGRRTFSAAQNVAASLELHTEAIFVGEPTGSSPNSIGDETSFVLPFSKVLANVADVYWQSGAPLDHRRWIAPQLYTPPTFAAYRANRDPAMEAILAYPKSSP